MAEDRSAAFDALVADQLPPLMRAALVLTGNAASAEDLVQSAMANAFLAWRQVLAAESPEAYLRRILINTHKRTFRRRRVRELLTADVPETAAEIVDTDARRDLVVAVASLPRRQRAVVALRYLEERSEAEVAAILGCSTGTVKSQLSRALTALRRHPALDHSIDPITQEAHP